MPMSCPKTHLQRHRLPKAIHFAQNKSTDETVGQPMTTCPPWAA